MWRAESPIGLSIIDHRGIVTFANDSICKVFDVDRSSVLGRPQHVFIGEEPIPSGSSQSRDLIRHLEHSDGTQTDVRLHFETIWLGATTRILVAATSVTDTEQMPRDGETGDDLLDTVLALSSEAVLAIDSSGTIRAASNSCMTIFGWPRHDLIGSKISVLMRADDSAAHESAIRRRLKSGVPLPRGERHDLVGLRRDGTPVPFQLRVADCPPSLGSRYLGFITDRSEVEALRSEMHHAERTDPLTDLMTRREFTEAAVHFLAHRSESMSLVKFDIRAFHNVNLIHGNQVGDELLRRTARDIEAIAGNGPVGRVGGDRFACLIETRNVDELVRDVDARVGSRRRTRGISHPLQLSAGAAQAVEGESFEHLMRDADLAVRISKSQRGTAAVVFDRTLGEQMKRRARLSDDAHLCISAWRLDTYFQPEVDLADYSVVGHEALVRWRHPEFGMISPDEFLPVFTSEGLMPELGLQVVTAALDFIRNSALSGYEGKVWVNLSAGQLYDDSVLNLAGSAIADGIDPSRMGFELTEQVAASVASGAHDNFIRIGELGVGLAIDDFGTGYSTLSELRSLPADLVKLDRSFLAGIETDPGQRDFVAACVDLAHKLGKTVLAEGIETERVAEIVTSLGCDLAQGYLFGRPMPSGQALGLLNSDS